MHLFITRRNKFHRGIFWCKYSSFPEKKFLTGKYFENEILVLHRSNSNFIMHIF